MPPNTLGNTGGPMDWFTSMPKLTRTYAALGAVMAASWQFTPSLISWLVLDWRKVVFELQVWRLVTSMAIIQPPGIPLLILLLYVLQYGSTLESSVYSIHPEDYLFLYIFSAGVLAVAAGLLGPVLGIAYMPVTGAAMVFVLLYVWSKNFQEDNVSLYGVVRIKGFWLPFISLGLMLVTGQGMLKECIIGIAVGHLWYFLTSIMPRAGQTVLVTPQWVRKLAIKLEMPGAVPAAPPVNPSSTGFRPFSGRGRRVA